jgi:adenylate cyclase
MSQDARTSKHSSGRGKPEEAMRLRIRSTLLFAIVALMACSLSAVSAVVLFRHLAVVQTVADREIEQAANDVAHRVSRFLENGPAVLNRVKYFIEHQGVALTDTGRMTDYLVSEAQASPALTWVSVSSVETGAFLGVTKRDGTLVLNRSDPAVDGGIAREWELRTDGTRTSLKTGPGVPYDPCDRAWFVQGVGTNTPSWTDPYQFPEGPAGISAVVGLRHPETGAAMAVATADFHLREIETFLSELRVGSGGRALIVAPKSTSGPLVLGAGADLPEEMRAAVTAITARVATDRSSSQHPTGRSDGLFRDTIGGVIVDGRALAVSGGLFWELVVMLPLADVEAPMWAATTAVIVTALIFLAIGVIAATAVAHAISRPICLINQDLTEIGELRFARTVPISSIREIDAMARSLVRMKAALRSFSIYVPIDVVRSVLTSGQAAEPGGELRVLTVLVSDVAGFTGIAENMPPRELVRHLGNYFDVLEQAVEDGGGLVDKFVGDGMLAFFNAPHRIPDHPARACEAALAAQRSLEQLSHFTDGAPPFPTRIGLATGEVLVGNIGTARRLSYTVIGDTVNLACRLEMLNKAYGTSILASGEVRHAAGSGFEWRHLDRVTVPGRSEPLELHELLGYEGDIDATRLVVRDLHEVAVQDLVAGRFDEAERGFRVILDMAPGDRPARYLLEHTMIMRTELGGITPSRDWGGVHVHRTKM